MNRTSLECGDSSPLSASHAPSRHRTSKGATSRRIPRRVVLTASLTLLLPRETFAAAPGLRVATFEADVTLPLGHPVYPSFKPLETIEQPLLAKGVVLDDGQRRCVLATIDWCVLSNGSRTAFRQAMAEAAGTGLPFVTIQAVHQHTAPVVDIDAQAILEKMAGTPPYLDRAFQAEVAARLGAAVARAVKRLAPCDQVGAGQARVERVASSRRIMGADGKLVVRMSSTKGKPQLRELPEGLIDPMLKTITFTGAGRPLVRLHYYATHPQSFYGDPRVSIDFPGIAREELQREEGVFQIYFTGCAGDIAAGKYNDGSPEARTQLAARIKAGMKAAAAATRYEPAGSLAWRTVPLLLPGKQTDTFSEEELRRTIADGRQTALRRILSARRLAFQQRKDTPIEVCSLQMGRIRILHLPGEPMIAFQLYAQQRRPDDFVAVAGYGEGCTNYLCTDQAYEEGGYEPGAAAVGPGTEALLKAAIDRMLGL